jgi:hypothetical protein
VASQRELMEQAEAMSMDLQSTIDQMRRTEAARLALSREAHDLKLKVPPGPGSNPVAPHAVICVCKHRDIVMRACSAAAAVAATRRTLDETSYPAST